MLRWMRKVRGRRRRRGALAQVHLELGPHEATNSGPRLDRSAQRRRPICGGERGGYILEFQILASELPSSS